MMTAIIDALKGLFLKLRALWTDLPDERKKQIREKIWSIMQTHFERKYEEHMTKKAKENESTKGATA